MGSESVATMALAAIVLGIVLLFVWIILPFAVFGIKPLLLELLMAQRRTNELLEQAARGKGESVEKSRTGEII